MMELAIEVEAIDVEIDKETYSFTVMISLCLL